MKFVQDNVATPSFVFDIDVIRRKSKFVNSLSDQLNFTVLYSLKALNLIEINDVSTKYLGGYSASTLFEAKLTEELLGGTGCVHFTSPGIRFCEIEELTQLCNFISFNSLSQWKRFKGKTVGWASAGLRINPQLSSIKDDRYDPCSKYSKLGVPIDNLVDVIKYQPDQLEGLDGLHFHTNCEATDFNPLYKTVLQLDNTISPLLENMRWINLGGGYSFDEDISYIPFEKAIDLLQSKYGLEVFIEPGKAFVKDAGYLVSSVIDLFESDGKQIAVLDTTVNHAPEVFEYQYSPDVVGHTDSGEYEYILAGCSCLAGDLFGEYCFDKPLEIGSRIVFEDMAAYSLVKANMFNGINLPSIYKYTENGSLEILKEYTYEDYRSRLGELSDDTLRKRTSNTNNQESSKVTSIFRR